LKYEFETNNVASAYFPNKFRVFLPRQQLLNQKLYIHPVIKIIGILVQYKNKEKVRAIKP